MMITSKTLKKSGLILMASLLLSFPVFTACDEKADSETVKTDNGSNVDNETTDSTETLDTTDKGEIPGVDVELEDETGEQTNENSSSQTFFGVCVGNTSVKCDGKCIDPYRDKDYCGAKKDCAGYEKCGSDEECFVGKCTKKYTEPEDSCSDGQVSCNHSCVDPKTNNTFCGAKAGCEDAIDCTQLNNQTCQDGACCVKFKDAAFKAYILGKYDANSDGKICSEEVSSVKEILEPDDKFKEMKTFDDLDSFPNLKKLGANVFAELTSVSEKSSVSASYIEEIGEKAFYRSNIKSVTMPKLLTLNTSDEATGMEFAECPNLTSISFHDLVKTSVNMFKNSKKLNSIYLPYVETISTGTFEGCEALKYIKVRRAITVEPHAFDNSGAEQIILCKATKIGFDKDGNQGPVFTNVPNLQTLVLNAGADFELSENFIDKQLASQVVLRIHNTKNAGGKHYPQVGDDNEWPAGSGIKWKSIDLKTHADLNGTVCATP